MALYQLPCSLGKYLKDMSVGPFHYIKDLFYKFEGNFFMEQVAHGVDKDDLGFFPPQGSFEHVGMNSEIEPVLVLGYTHPLQSLGHALGVAMPAPGADGIAPGDRVPGPEGPLDG